MKYTRYGKHTPQTEPLDGMEPNNGGGFSYTIDPIAQLKRFCILGSEGGTYYTGERTLTRENLKNVEALLRAGRGKEVVDTIAEISLARRAPSEDPLLFALARCCACDAHGRIEVPYTAKKNTVRDQKAVAAITRKYHLRAGHPRTIGRMTYTLSNDTVLLDRAAGSGMQLDPRDIEVRRYAYSRLPEIARTGTAFLHFQYYVSQFRGWGSAQRSASQLWYQDKNIAQVAYQAVKYRNRDGWSQRDVLRLSHPMAKNDRVELYKWIVKGELEETIPEGEHDPLALVRGYEHLLQTTDADEQARLICAYRIPRAAVPTEMLGAPQVWEAIFEHILPEELIRNLGSLTAKGILAPMGSMTRRAGEILRDEQMLIKMGVHPLKILKALRQYGLGHGKKGTLTWTPLRSILDALDEAFYLSYGAFTPAEKRLLLALDVSGSMTIGHTMGVEGLTPRSASAAMALVTAAREPNYMLMGFSDTFMPLSISPRQRLDDVERAIDRLDFGSTDCALPMTWALKNNVEIDTFVVYTDNETNCNTMHPSVALERYRQKMDIDAKLVVVAMTSTGFSIADPQDPGMLDCVGFDSATPEIIVAFSKGEV